MAETITGMLVDEVGRLSAKPSPEALRVAGHSALDWLGCVIAAKDDPLVQILIAEAKAQGGRPISTILPEGERTSPALAALVNAAASDAIDFSTSHLMMRGHPGNAVTGAALAVAEADSATGDAFLAAFVAGVEIECRMGLMLFPAFMSSGAHPTGSIAPFGATMAAARLHGLDRQATINALGIVASEAAGLLANGGSMAKPHHSGKAAMNGVLAAGLAKRGFTPHGDAIGAKQGFLDVALRGFDPEAMQTTLAAVEGRFLILDTLIKTHAACTLTHSSIENMLKLTGEHHVAPGEIASVSLAVPATHLKVCNIEVPRTGLEAKFSLKATAAMALLGDDMTSLDAYNDRRAVDPEVTQLMRKIEVQPRTDIANYMSRAEAVLTDGRRVEVASDTGQPIRGLDRQRDVVTAKFMRLAAPVMGESAAERAMQVTLGLETAESVVPLVEAATRAR